MTGYHLTATTFLPLVGAVVILLVGSERLARWIALAATVATLAVSVPLYRDFDKASSALQFVESRDWIPSWNIAYSMGVDGISLPFIFLSSVLSVLCIGASWSAIQRSVREFYAALLVAETAMIGLFAASNLFVFYIFWELMIVPLFLLIGGWGGPGRVYAAVKFLLFTLAGSVLMLVGMVALYHTFGTLDFRALAQAGPSLQPGHQARRTLGKRTRGLDTSRSMGKDGPSPDHRSGRSPLIERQARCAWRAHHSREEKPCPTAFTRSSNWLAHTRSPGTRPRPAQSRAQRKPCAIFVSPRSSSRIW